MFTLCERLNTTTIESEAPIHAMSLKIATDNDVFDNLCLYCSENNINLKDIDDNDFSNCADLIRDQLINIHLPQYPFLYFWIDQA